MWRSFSLQLDLKKAERLLGRIQLACYEEHFLRWEGDMRLIDTLEATAVPRT